LGTFPMARFRVMGAMTMRFRNVREPRENVSSSTNALL
jgi:hypothetical protein